jgi:hypothetical protein
MSREVSRVHAIARAFAWHVPPAPPRAHVSVPATLPPLPSVPSRHRELHSFAVALDYRDLCHLVLEDGNAHAALLAVVTYLQRYDPSGRPSRVLFSGRPKELNGTLAFVDATVSTPGWEELHRIEQVAQEYCRFEVGVGGGDLEWPLSEPWANGCCWSDALRASAPRVATGMRNAPRFVSLQPGVCRRLQTGRRGATEEHQYKKGGVRERSDGDRCSRSFVPEGDQPLRVEIPRS